jgi:aminoglycoside phosphotransferase (APT) family kinase protein
MMGTHESQGASLISESQAKASFAERLLSLLRDRTGQEGATFAEAPKQVSGGFDTSIYRFRLKGASEEWSKPLVLRLFRPDSRGEARREKAVHDVVNAADYPAPRVLLAEEDRTPLGGELLVMERLPGMVMLNAYFRPTPRFFRLAGIFAEAHARLHALDPERLRRTLAEHDADRSRARGANDVELAADMIDRVRLDGLRPGLEWLRANQPRRPARDAICHGDFHPLNIMLQGETVTGVIDWAWTSVGDPAYDVGASVAVFGQGPVDLPGFTQGAVGWFRRRVIRSYLRAYEALRPLDLDAVRYYEALRCLGFLLEAGEHLQADAGVVPRPTKPSAFGAPLLQASIVERFEEITGVGVALPRPPA